VNYRRSPLMEQRLKDNRERILKAARKLVAQGGFRAASVSAVSKAAGLSTGAIYRYFPSKSALMVEILTHAVSHEVDVLREITARADSSTDKLAAAVRSFGTRALEGRNLAYAFIAELTDPEVEAARIVGREDFGDVFKDLLHEGIDRGEFPAQSVDVTAACIVGAFTEALVRPVAPTTLPEAAEPDLVEKIVVFCVAAVRRA